MTYRIVNLTVLTAGLALVGVIILLHVLDIGQCSLQAYNGGECAVCGCTRDFFRLLHGNCRFQNPLSPFLFAAIAFEAVFRLVLLFMRPGKRLIVTDAVAHALVLGAFMVENFRIILKST